MFLLNPDAFMANLMVSVADVINKILREQSGWFFTLH
jgi:hypothetical protein